MRLALLLLVFGAGAARADDWPQWRGLNRDGAWNEKGILENFPAGGLEVRWRAPVGIGYSTPIVAGGRVYVTASELAKPVARERVHCFDEATGRPIWSHAYAVTYPDWAFEEASKKGPDSTPIVRDRKLYTLGAVGHLHCFDAATGEVLWQRDLQKDYPASELRCTPSPLIEGDLLILSVGAAPAATVIAFDKNTGKEVWTSIDERATYSSPLCITAGGARQLIVWTMESVTSLDPATGRLHWREALSTGTDAGVSSPVLQGDLLLIGAVMLKLDAGKPAATVLWPEKRSVARSILSNTSTALILGDHAYSARSSGELVCLELGKGGQVWKADRVTDLKQGACIHLTPNGDSVLISNERGELIRATLAPGGYKEISRAAILEPSTLFAGRKCSWSPPSFANRHLFARNDTELICVSLAAKP
jgi:outer membrane protein assembly factor BamB